MPSPCRSLPDMLHCTTHERLSVITGSFPNDPGQPGATAAMTTFSASYVICALRASAAAAHLWALNLLDLAAKHC